MYMAIWRGRTHARRLVRTVSSGSRISEAFVPYTLRHTALTKLGEKARGDLFVLAKIAGHSSITVSQRYIHPQAEAINRVFSQVGTKLGTVGWGEPLKWHKFFGLSFRL